MGLCLCMYVNIPVIALGTCMYPQNRTGTCSNLGIFSLFIGPAHTPDLVSTPPIILHFILERLVSNFFVSCSDDTPMHKSCGHSNRESLLSLIVFHATLLSQQFMNQTSLVYLLFSSESGSVFRLFTRCGLNFVNHKFILNVRVI